MQVVLLFGARSGGVCQRSLRLPLTGSSTACHMLATAPSSPTYTMASHRPHIHTHTHTHAHGMATHCHSLEYVHERHCIGRTNAVSPCVLTSAPHIHATSPPSPPVIQAHTSRPASAPAPALSSSLLLHKCHPPFDQRSRLRPLRSRQPTYVCIRGG